MMKHAKARAVGLIATGVITGGVLAGTLSANAASPTTSGTPATYTGLAGSGPGAPAHRFGSAPVRSDESALSASLTSSLTTKAEAKTGGTVYRVESDAGDGKYEAHVRKTDGTLVTVKFDSAGNITAVESGMGQGDPAPAGGGQPPTTG
jgi:hypothetical protein